MVLQNIVGKFVLGSIALEAETLRIKRMIFDQNQPSVSYGGSTVASSGGLPDQTSSSVDTPTDNQSHVRLEQIPKTMRLAMLHGAQARPVSPVTKGAPKNQKPSEGSSVFTNMKPVVHEVAKKVRNEKKPQHQGSKVGVTPGLEKARREGLHGNARLRTRLAMHDNRPSDVKAHEQMLAANKGARDGVVSAMVKLDRDTNTEVRYQKSLLRGDITSMKLAIERNVSNFYLLVGEVKGNKGFAVDTELGEEFTKAFKDKPLGEALQDVRDGGYPI